MAKLPGIVPITDLRQDAAAVVERARKSAQPVVITQRGRASVVLVSAEAYEKSEAEMRLLKRLLLGEREVRKGKGFDLEDVLLDADELLSR